MASFNENLGDFLTEYCSNALVELRQDERYIILQNRQKELRSKLSQVLESETAKLLDDFTETVSLIHGIECNKVIVYGLTLWREIQKRFDSSLPEGTFMQAYVFNELSDEE